METNDSQVPTETLYPQSIALKIAKAELILCGNPNFSRCWDVFAKIEDANGAQIPGFVHCRICKKVLIYKPPSHANLVRHKCYAEKFKTQSPTTNTEVAKECYDSNLHNVQSPTTNIEVKKECYDTNLHLEVVQNPGNNLTQLITKWLINDCRSYDLLQIDALKAIFQQFIEFGAKYGSRADVDRLLPSSTDVARNVSEIYEQCLGRVKLDIELMKENGFGLVVDAVSDNFASYSYIVLTVHFLKNGALTFRLLALRSMQGEQLASQNIHEAVEAILNDFDCKLSTQTIIVTNGGADFTEAFQSYENLTCISHLLNQALQKSVEEVPEVEELVRAGEKLVNYLRYSQLNNSFSSPLPSFCARRWNTMYNMLYWLENNWYEIDNILQEQNEHQLVQGIELNCLKSLNKTLRPFEEALDELEEDNCATLHLVLMYLHQLRKACDTNDSEFKDLDVIEMLKERLQLHLEQIATENITMLHKIALFLYPPTNKLLQFSPEEKKCIEDECIRLMMSYESELKPIVKQETDVTMQPLSKRKKLFTDFMEPETNCNRHELINQELQCYKYMRVVNSEDFDVFSWWQQQKHNFPLLFKLSCTVLATPASSSSAQRIFSNAGSLLCQNMFDLSRNETNVAQIMFVNSNSEPDDLESEFELK